MTDPTHSPTPPWASARPLHRIRRRLRRRWVLHRRWLAAGTLALAVLVALRALSPAPPPQTDAVVAVRDLPGGQRLGADDLAVRQVPRDVIPEGAVPDTAALVGRTLASPTRAGEVVTDRRVLDEGLLAAYPGTVAVPARLADAAARALLRVGDTVDLVAASPQGRAASVVAASVPVLALPSGSRSPAAGGRESGALVVVAVSPDDALRVAQASAAGVIGVVLLG
jgi:Flp pilus assembly protein CpaB